MAKENEWYMNQSPLGAAYRHFSAVAAGKTVLDTKTKELIRLSVASIFRCKHCTEHHIQDALKAGATKQEISESLLLSALQSAGTQLNWHREYFDENLT